MIHPETNKTTSTINTNVLPISFIKKNELNFSVSKKYQNTIILSRMLRSEKGNCFVSLITKSHL